MSKFAIRLLTLAMLSMAVFAAPVLAWAAPDSDPPPSDSKGKKKKSSENTTRSYAAFADGHRAASATTDARQGRERRRRQPDRLLLPQARRLQGVANLVRARAEGRSEPCQDLAVLRPVAGRTGAHRPRAR